MHIIAVSVRQLPDRQCPTTRLPLVQVCGEHIPPSLMSLETQAPLGQTMWLSVQALFVPHFTLGTQLFMQVPLLHV
jgi:hypothetical protein